MVRPNRVEDVGTFAGLFSQLHAQEGVRQLAFLVADFSNVVEQACALRGFGVEAQFRSHGGAEVRDFTAVLKQVLPVRGAVLHAAHHPDELALHVVDAQVNHRALSGLGDFLFNFLSDLVHHLLDAGRVDAAVGDKLMQAEAGDLTAHWVEAAQDDGLGGVVHNELHAGCRFQRADVASFASDDAALDVVVLDLEDRDAVLHAVLGGDALDGLDDNLLGFRIGLFLGLVDDVLRLGGSHGAGFRLHLLDHVGLGLIRGHAAEFLQGFNGLGVVGVEVLLLFLQSTQTLGELLLVLLELALCVLVLVDGALEVALRLFDALLTLVELALQVFALVGLLLFELDELLLGLEDLLFLDGLAFQLGFADDAVCFAGEHAQEQKVACASSEKQSSCCCNDG